jgi:hypothetical protein
MIRHVAQAKTIRELEDRTRNPIVKIYRGPEQICESFERAKYVPTLKIEAGRLLGIAF